MIITDVIIYIYIYVCASVTTTDEYKNRYNNKNYGGNHLLSLKLFFGILY